MKTLSVRDFRSNIASSLNLVDAGESVLIRRNRQLYTIVPVQSDDLAITPSLADKIEKARKEMLEGKFVSLKSHEDIDRFFE